MVLFFVMLVEVGEIELFVLIVVLIKNVEVGGEFFLGVVGIDVLELELLL